MTRLLATPIALIWIAFAVLGVMSVAHHAALADNECPAHRMCFADTQG